MNCPDCKIPMDKIDTVYDKKLGKIIEIFPYYKCPRCKIEIDDEDDELN